MKIAEIARVLAGYQARKGIEPTQDGSHYLLQIRDFNAERTAIESASLIRFSPPSVKEDQVLRDGDVIFLAKGAKNFGFAPEGIPGPALAAGYFFILRPQIDVHPAYLAWFLTQEASRQYFARNSGTTAHMPVVRRGVLENLPIALPSLDIQRTIVELERLILQEHALYRKLAEKRRALWTAVCLNAATGNERRESDHD